MGDHQATKENADYVALLNCSTPGRTLRLTPKSRPNLRTETPTPMSKLLEFLGSEWSTLTSAPLSFATLVTLSFGAAFFVIRWAYKTRLAQLKERLSTKEDTISAYRDRLDLASEDKSTDPELKKL